MRTSTLARRIPAPCKPPCKGGAGRTFRGGSRTPARLPAAFDPRAPGAKIHSVMNPSLIQLTLATAQQDDLKRRRRPASHAFAVPVVREVPRPAAAVVAGAW